MAMGKSMPGCSVGMKNCCHDEHKHVQSDRAQRPVQSWAEWNLTPALVVLSFQGWKEPMAVASAIAQPAASGPPLSGTVPVFLRNCNFRI
jgi:hypothetical protein